MTIINVSRIIQEDVVGTLRSEYWCEPWMMGANLEEKKSRVLIYFGGAKTGELRWKLRVDDHRDATMTGTPAI